MLGKFIMYVCHNSCGLSAMTGVPHLGSPFRSCLHHGWIGWWELHFHADISKKACDSMLL